MGSSPLARGLPPVTPAGPRTPGIIPARAGFTRTRSPVAARSGDHPRSRGVYRPGAVAEGESEGSSPLARGLQDPRQRAHVPDRIIPARAGFTLRVRRAWLRRRDHPRSRGVYNPRPGGSGPLRGSSPLARGLPVLEAGCACGARIIPARAGFTRGAGRLDQLPSGSSPLARGLQGRVLGLGALDRIIPARAGFTRRQAPNPRPGGDHPRSRGVYSCSPPPTPPEDHPRSRGVYSVKNLAMRVVRGSSPLARGLPDLPEETRVTSRIIPARAGFTADCSGGRGFGWDHPRSRGVYSQS